jgi:phenylalanine-4-hydroxylase
MPHRTLTEVIPEYLRPYVANQDPTLYTPIDHAAWRFILKISQDFFTEHAHQKYLDGLNETGISTERIPLIAEMDAKLRRFGWRAVAVSGFIPPAVFMEFQSLGILPIACEMRTLDHLAYTPAPDIVHEAAGHAPILADPEYADYLRSYGEVARKAIYSSKDMALYEAIRELSDIKEDPTSTIEQIQAAQKHLDETIASVDYISEATYLSRMFWWTVEYGLVGSTHDPKIYGAGLLSSVGESYACLDEKVHKLPLTLDCVNMSYDITRPQPQLFITPDFPTLKKILDRFSESMAFKRGGVEGLVKAKTARTLTTTVLETGLQISGVLTDFWADQHGRPTFLRFSGPCQLSVNDQELAGQGVERHREGYSTPLGRVRIGQQWKPASELTEKDFQGKLEFESGIEVVGRLTAAQFPYYVTLEDCTVRQGKHLLYRPEWGPFDLALGLQVQSVFGGAGDRQRYLRGVGGYQQKPRKPKTNLTDENRALNGLYAEVRTLREKQGRLDQQVLEKVASILRQDYPDDWLLRFELLELAKIENLSAPWVEQVNQELEGLARSDLKIGELIQRGRKSLQTGVVH